MRVFCLLGFLTLWLIVTGDEVIDAPIDSEGFLGRLEEVEKRGLQQDIVIRQLQNTIEKQNGVIQEQADVIHKLEMDVENLKEALENSASPIEEVMSPSKRLVLGGEVEGPIAFHARIDKGSIEHIGITQKIVFDVTVLNIGTGYHNSSGIFTAPAPGLYFFSVSVCILHTGKDIHAEIMKNGAEIAGSYANSFDQGSVSTVIPLVAGDEVWVSSIRAHPDAYLWGDTLTSFMGYRIDAM